jgi:hypothetical protein
LQSVAQVWQADNIPLVNAEMTGIRMNRFASSLLSKAQFQHNEIKNNVKFLK